MTKEQEFRKQTEEAKFEAFSLMCKKVAELEKENAELKAFRQDCVKLTEDNVVIVRQRAETSKQLTKAKELLKHWVNSYGRVDITLCKESQKLISELEK